MSVSTTTTVTDSGQARGVEAASRCLDAPVDGAGLGAFRALFGGLMVLAVIRFAWLGWIDELYVAPTYHFTYLGFEWVQRITEVNH